MDGYSRWQTIWRLVLPLSAPGIAVGSIVAFLISWNEFAFALIFTAYTPSETLPLALSSGLAGYGQGAVEIFAAIGCISLIPSIVGAYLVQRFIVNLRITSTVFKLDEGI